MMAPRFAFPAETLAFLADLGHHNSKTWFDANRPHYETAYLRPAKAFVETIAPALEQLVPGITAPTRSRPPRCPGRGGNRHRDWVAGRSRSPHIAGSVGGEQIRQPRSGRRSVLVRDVGGAAAVA